MTRRLWNIIVLLAFISLTFTNINGLPNGKKTKTSPGKKESHKTAFEEKTKTNSETSRRLREAFGLPGFYDFLAPEMSETQAIENFFNASQANKPKSPVKLTGKGNLEGLRPFLQPKVSKPIDVNVEIGKPNEKKLSKSKQNEILKKIGAKEITRLDGIRRANQEKSELETYLEKNGVADYQEVSKSFDVTAEVKVVDIPEEIILLRLYGGESKAIGRYMFCCLEFPSNAPPVIKQSANEFMYWVDASSLALPPGNLQQNLALLRVPVKTKFVVGDAADNFKDSQGNYRKGGNTQFFLINLENITYEEYHAAQTSKSNSDIYVNIDGNIVRYTRSPSLSEVFK